MNLKQNEETRNSYKNRKFKDRLGKKMCNYI